MGLFDRLRNTKPIIHMTNPELGGRLNPRFRGVEQVLPMKIVMNTRHDPELLSLYAKGALRYENTGRTCENCVNFYYDRMSPLGGRCKARGFMQTHPDTPADTTRYWVHPTTGQCFDEWPECPLFVLKERLSRK